MRGLKDKVVIITGGGRGIGLACAERFIEEGSRVCLIDRAFEEGLDTRLGERAHLLTADITKEVDLVRVAEWVAVHGCHVLINNAGITRDATLSKMSLEAWESVIQVNLTAVFRMSQLVVDTMRVQNSGVILNAASVVAHYGNFGQANYSATKAGVIGMTKTLSKELGKHNIRVNAVAPGFIETPMVAAMPEKVIQMVMEKPALKRMGQPEEVAGVYAFLASDDARYITGTCINVDGGIVLG